MADYLSDDKIAECKEIFDLFDQNGDGYIGIKELEEILRALGTSIPYERIVELCKKANHNFYYILIFYLDQNFLKNHLILL